MIYYWAWLLSTHAGTPSTYMIMCLELSVDEDVDIVFTEYVLNDGFDISNKVGTGTYACLPALSAT